MKLVTAPKHEYPDDGKPRLFLAGGISDCHDWQSTLTQELKDHDVTIYNPRRENFNIFCQKDSKKQIKWERCFLIDSEIIVFYFCQETLCPITLFELGGALERSLGDSEQDILIYCEPEYRRKFDVEYQVKLVTDILESRSNHFSVIKTYQSYKSFLKGLIHTIELYRS